MGYTPLFDSLTSGTLCGRWPDVGLWPIVLSLTDSHGLVDKTPTFIASVTGLPLAEVVACMARFCEPDPYSRSQEHGGARLVLIDPARPWGWRVVNHSKYRDKARKAAFDARRTESGADAERKRAERVPTCPDESRAVPPSNTNTNTNTNTEEEKKGNAAAPLPPLPDDLNLTAWAEWVRYRAERKLPRYREPTIRKLTEFLAKHAQTEQQAIVDYSVRNGYQGLFEPKDSTNGNGQPKTRVTAFERSKQALDDWARERGIDPATI
jgi:hypothetical protein